MTLRCIDKPGKRIGGRVTAARQGMIHMLHFFKMGRRATGDISCLCILVYGGTCPVTLGLCGIKCNIRRQAADGDLAAENAVRSTSLYFFGDSRPSASRPRRPCPDLPFFPSSPNSGKILLRSAHVYFFRGRGWVGIESQRAPRRPSALRLSLEESSPKSAATEIPMPRDWAKRDADASGVLLFRRMGPGTDAVPGTREQLAAEQSGRMPLMGLQQSIGERGEIDVLAEQPRPAVGAVDDVLCNSAGSDTAGATRQRDVNRECNCLPSRGRIFRFSGRFAIRANGGVW